MSTLQRTRVLAALTAIFTLWSLCTVSPASAASRNGICEEGEFCYYYLSTRGGSVSDFSGSIRDYGGSQPTCYEFLGAGSGKGLCVKNNAASVWNRSIYTVRVYFNTGYSGPYEDVSPGGIGNLNSTLKNNNASHVRFNAVRPPPTPTSESMDCDSNVIKHVNITGYGRRVNVSMVPGWRASAPFVRETHWHNALACIGDRMPAGMTGTQMSSLYKQYSCVMPSGTGSMACRTAGIWSPGAPTCPGPK